MNKLLQVGTIALSALIACNSTSFAVPTPAQYTQRRVQENSYGAAFTASGSVDHLNSSSTTPYPLNKALWMTFPPQLSNPNVNEWVEIGGGKGLTASTVAQPNPQIQEQSYWSGHYFTYQRFDSSGSRWYYEGRIGSANPIGSHRYKLERDFSSTNKWCSYVNNIGAYCITIAGAGSYNSAAYTTIGIESQDSAHSFTNGTSASNIWHYPTSASGFQIFGGTFANADNNNRGWYSNWFPLQNGNNGIGFYNQ